MARRALDYALHSKTARLKLRPRPKPYYRQIAPGVTLGYFRRSSGPGAWVVRELDGGSYKYRTLGAADDVGRADGRDVLTFEQAQAKTTRPAPTAARSGRMTVSDAMDRYLIVLAGRSGHAKEARQRADKHIIPMLGATRVERLTKDQIQGWLAGMVKDEDEDDPDARRRSQDSANRILTILKAALNNAFADVSNNIASDTAWRTVKPFKDVATARSDQFNATQVRSLIAKATTFDKAFADLLEAGYLTGARYGELSALEVRDFDAGKAVLMIRKGKTGARPVTLTAEAVGFFKRMTAKRPAAAILLPRADGAPWGKSEQARPFKRAAVLAKLPESASFYTLRHSHISRAIDAGMPLSLVAENCGTSLTMIQRNYAKVLANLRRGLVEKTSPKLRRVK